MCNLAMNSSHFEGRVRFMGRDSEVQHGHCGQRIISFTSQTARKRTARREFFEWMIGCNAAYPYFSKHRGSNLWYYIAPAYGVPNEAFVFRGAKEDSNVFVPVVFENLSGNLGFHIPKLNAS